MKRREQLDVAAVMVALMMTATNSTDKLPDDINTGRSKLFNVPPKYYSRSVYAALTLIPLIPNCVSLCHLGRMEAAVLLHVSDPDNTSDLLIIENSAYQNNNCVLFSLPIAIFIAAVHSYQYLDDLKRTLRASRRRL